MPKFTILLMPFALVRSWRRVTGLNTLREKLGVSRLSDQETGYWPDRGGSLSPAARPPVPAAVSQKCQNTYLTPSCAWRGKPLPPRSIVGTRNSRQPSVR